LGGLPIGYFWFISLPVYACLVLPFTFGIAEMFSGGRTAGKALLGIAVRDASGRPATRKQLFSREFNRGLGFLLLVVPFFVEHLSMLRDPHKRTGHDRHANTIVVRQPSRRAA